MSTDLVRFSARAPASETVRPSHRPAVPAASSAPSLFFLHGIRPRRHKLARHRRTHFAILSTRSHSLARDNSPAPHMLIRGAERIGPFVSDMVVFRSFYEHALALTALAPHAANHVHIPAAENGIALEDGPDTSANITTFMVNNFPRRQEVLPARGVQFARTLEYSIGTTADFYDPDGHWFSLYQSSEAAVGWPSRSKLQALASGLPMRHFTPVSPVDAAPEVDDLADAFIAYVFSDPDVAARFYSGLLEFDVIEGGPCRRISTRAPAGVVKYDVGATMLTTHHVESDDKRFRVATAGTGGVAFAFQVAHLTMAVSALSRRGIIFSGWLSESHIGRLERFMDLVIVKASWMRASKYSGESPWYKRTQGWSRCIVKQLREHSPRRTRSASTNIRRTSPRDVMRNQQQCADVVVRRTQELIADPLKMACSPCPLLGQFAAV
jgi:hypothetical protein